MNRTLIVFYELATPAINRDTFIKKLKGYAGWARLGTGAYLIVTSSEPVVVRDDLMQVMLAADRVFVGLSPAPSAWAGLPEDVSNWLQNNQK